MPIIKIINQKQIENGWSFLVSIDNDNFIVELNKDYWQQLTNGCFQPDELIKRSFKFLLAREPKGSILKRFNLREISKYFPQYEVEIGK